MDPVDALTTLDGVARWADLRARGVARRSLASAVELGDVLRPGRGFYVLPGARDTDLARAVEVGGVLSCGSAALHHGLEVFGSVEPHVTVSTPRQPTPRSLVVHRRAVERGPRVTPLARTLADCCRCLPIAQAVSVLDSALRQGRVEPDELAALVPAKGRWAARARWAVALVDPQAQSVLESAARVLLVTHDVGSIASQVHVVQVGWVDLMVDGWLVVEVDGYDVHKERFAQDRRRDAELVRQGYVVLRFTYADVRRRPRWVIEVVRDALRRRAHS